MPDNKRGSLISSALQSFTLLVDIFTDDDLSWHISMWLWSLIVLRGIQMGTLGGLGNPGLCCGREVLDPTMTVFTVLCTCLETTDSSKS